MIGKKLEYFALSFVELKLDIQHIVSFNGSKKTATQPT